MATTVTTIDDLTGEPGAEAVRFSLQGVEYEIDLTGDSLGNFEDVLSPYVERARKIAPNADKGRKNSGSGRTAQELAQVREWAHANGVEVAARGRISSSVLDAFDARAPHRREADVLTGETVAVEVEGEPLDMWTEEAAPTIIEPNIADESAVVVKAPRKSRAKGKAE